MIETVARNPGNKKLLYSKFNDTVLPRPRWLIEDDLKNLEKERLSAMKSFRSSLEESDQ